MWKAIIGKASERSETSSSQSSRRKDETERTASRRRSESIVSSSSARKPHRGEDRDRGFNPSSTSYSSSSRTAFPGTAPASVASSYATASSNQPDQPFMPPGLVRNASLADRMSKPKSSRDDRTRDDDRGHRSERRPRSTSRERPKGHKERFRSRDRESKRRPRKGMQDEQNSYRDADRGLSRSYESYTDDQSTARAGDYSVQAGGNFNAQVGSSGFTQFPGQYDGGLPSFAPVPLPGTANMSSHVPDQFPGQFPSQATAPYRPPLATNEGGPGLAAEYYGDAGQSVADQPGVRPQQPTLIVGAEPHLQAASPISAPPVEPSATGNVGAAASFFSGADVYQTPPASSLPLNSLPSSSLPSSKPPSSKPPKPGKQSKPDRFDKPHKYSGAAAVAGSAALGYAASSGTSNFIQGQSGIPLSPFQQESSNTTARPTAGYPPTIAAQGSTHHSSSAPVIPTLGAAVTGAAAGYAMGHHSSSYMSRPPEGPFMGGTIGGYGASSSQQHEAQNHATHTPVATNGRPNKPGKHISQTNLPLYAAGLAGSATSAAAAYQSHHSPTHSTFNNPYQSGSMAQQHRHRGPLSKLINFLKDPEGVASFEEYTEYIGVCKYCFAPGSSPRDAPRKHHYRRRGSNERYGSSTRIDKESRYWSSDGESRRRNGKSWLATGMAGYGLAKIGKSSSHQPENHGRTNGVQYGRPNYSNGSPPSRPSEQLFDKRSHTSHGITYRPSDNTARYRSRSKDHVETGITSDGRGYKKDPHGSLFGTPTISTYDTRRRRSRSRSRSSSRDRRSGVTGAALGTAIGSSIATSSMRYRSRSPKVEFKRSKRRSRERSPSRGSLHGKGASLSSPKRHHSPSTSYVDVSRAYSKPSSGVFGGLFSSRSEKRPNNKRKKPKGFFNFGNSSSSSDAGLAYGATLLHAERSKQTKMKWNDPRSTNAAILGLSAAAAALAANDSSFARQRRRRPDVEAVREPRNKHGRLSEPSHKSRRSSTSSTSDGVWEDASEDDDSSSVSSGLAYGGPARNSQDSLLSETSGTSKWGWRWGSRKNQKNPTFPANYGSDFKPPAGIMAGNVGGNDTGPILRSDNRRDGAMSSVSRLPSMQHVYPVPTSDPSRFDISRQSSTMSSSLPMMAPRPNPIPLQQPQPITPVSSAIYTTQPPYVHSYSAPTGPPVFSRVPPQPQPTVLDVQNARIAGPPHRAVADTSHYREPERKRVLREASMERDRYRRNSSPVSRTSIVEPSATISRERDSTTQEQGSAVRFDVVTAQTKKEQRDRRLQEEEVEIKRQRMLLREENERADQEKQDRRRRKEADDTKRERSRLQEANTEQDRRDKRRMLEKEDLKSKHRAMPAADEQADVLMKRKRNSVESTNKSGSRTRRGEDYDMKAQRLYNQERALEESKNTTSSRTPGVAGATEFMGDASFAVVKALDGKEDQRKLRNKQQNNDDFDKDNDGRVTGTEPKVVPQDSDDENSRQKHVARKAASMVASRPRHEDYAAYFVPTELLAQSGDRKQPFDSNADNEITLDQKPHIITIEPTGRNGPRHWPAAASDTTSYMEDFNHVALPRPVPTLNLIEPTPPHSIAGSSKGDASPIMRPEHATIADLTEAEKPSTASKVTWAEPETVEYTVITPLEFHDEFVSNSQMPPLPEKVKGVVSGSQPVTSEENKAIVVPVPVELSQHIPGEFGDDLEFAATLAAGLQDTGFDPSIVIDDPTYRRRDSPPGSESAFVYRHPFFETVTDIGLDAPGTEGDPPQRGFIEGELPSTPKDEQSPSLPGSFDRSTDVKLTKKEKRRRDKAAKRQADDTTFTPENSSTIPSQKSEVLEEVNRYSEEPERMVAIPNETSEDIGGSGNVRKSNRKISPERTGSPKEGRQETVSHQNNDGHGYLDVQELQISPSIPDTEQDRQAVDLAASIPLPEDEANVPNITKRSSTDDSRYDNADKGNAKPITSQLDVIPTTSPNVLRSGYTDPDDDRDTTQNVEDSDSRNEQRDRESESTRDNSQARNVQSRTHIASEPAEIEGQGKRRRKSKRHSVADDSPELKSQPVSAPATELDDYEESRKGRKKSERHSASYDDAESAASAPAAFENEKASKSKSKKDKKGGLFGLFSSSKLHEDIPEGGRDRQASPEVDDFQEAKKSKRKSKGRSSSGDVYDLYGAAAQSVGDLSQIGQPRADSNERILQKSREKEEKRRSRKGNIAESGTTTQDLPFKDEGLTSATEDWQQSTSLDSAAAAGIESRDDVPSFLGPGNDLPPVLDGIEPALSPDTQGASLQETPRPTLQSKNSGSTSSALAIVRSPLRGDRAEKAAVLPKDNPTTPVKLEAEERRPSDLQPTIHIPVSPAVPSSTAVPLHFRTPRTSLGLNRSSSLSSPTVGSDSPLSLAPRTRQARPSSTEFKFSTEFRPLWLVERHKSREQFDTEEPYPSLPSSRTTSRSSSVHQIEEKDRDDELKIEKSYEISPINLDSGVSVEHASDELEFLDSQQPTPVASKFPSSVQQHIVSPEDEQALQPDCDFDRHIQIDSPNELKSTTSQISRSVENDTVMAPDPSSTSLSEVYSENLQSLPPLPASGHSSNYGDDELLSSTAIEDAAVAIGALVGDAAASVLGRERRDKEHLPPSAAIDDVHSDKNVITFSDAAKHQPEYLAPRIEPTLLQSEETTEDDNSKPHTDMASTPHEDDTAVVDLAGPTATPAGSTTPSVEQQRQLQEQDAQDAVDGWFASPTIKRTKKENQCKKKLSRLEDPAPSEVLAAFNYSSVETTTSAAPIRIDNSTKKSLDLAMPGSPSGNYSDQKELSATGLPSSELRSAHGDEGVEQALPTRQTVEVGAKGPDLSIRTKKAKGKKKSKQNKWFDDSVEAPSSNEGQKTHAVPNLDEDGVVTYSDAREESRDVLVVTEPLALEETDVTPRGETSKTGPNLSPLELETVPEIALQLSKSKKGKKKSKQNKWSDDSVEAASLHPVQETHAGLNQAEGEGVTYTNRREDYKDVGLATEPPILEETNMRLQDESLSAGPKLPYVEAETIPESVFQQSKSKKGKKKAKQAHQTGAGLGVSPMKSLPALEADSAEDQPILVRTLSLPQGIKVKAESNGLNSDSVADPSSNVDSMAGISSPMKRKGKYKKKRILDQQSEPETPTADTNPTAGRREASEQPGVEPLAGTLEHSLAANKLQEARTVSEPVSSPKARATSNKSLPAIERPDQQDLESEYGLSTLPRKDRSSFEDIFNQSATAFSVPKTNEDGERAECSDEHGVPSPLISAYPPPDVPSPLAMEQDIVPPPPPDMGPLPEDTDRGLDHALEDERPRQDVTVDHTMTSLETNITNTLLSTFPSPKSEPLSGTAGAFPTERKSSAKVPPEMIPLPADADLGLHPLEGEGHEQDSVARDAFSSLEADVSEPLQQIDGSPDLEPQSDAPGAFSTEQSSPMSIGPEILRMPPGKDVVGNGQSEDSRALEFDLHNIESGLEANNINKVRQENLSSTTVALSDEIPGAFPTAQTSSLQAGTERVPLSIDEITDLYEPLRYDQSRSAVTAGEPEHDAVAPRSEIEPDGAVMQEEDMPASISQVTELPGAFPTQQKSSLQDTPEEVHLPPDERIDPYPVKDDTQALTDALPGGFNYTDAMREENSPPLPATPAIELPGGFPTQQKSSLQDTPEEVRLPPDERIDPYPVKDDSQALTDALPGGFNYTDAMREENSPPIPATPAIELPGGFPAGELALLTTETMDADEQQNNDGPDIDGATQQERSSLGLATPAVELPGAFPEQNSSIPITPESIVPNDNEFRSDIDGTMQRYDSSLGLATPAVDLPGAFPEQKLSLKFTPESLAQYDNELRSDLSDAVQQEDNSLALTAPAVELPGAFPEQKSSLQIVPESISQNSNEFRLELNDAMQQEDNLLALKTPALELPGAFPKQKSSLEARPENPEDQFRSGFHDIMQQEDSSVLLATPAIELPGAFPKPKSPADIVPERPPLPSFKNMDSYESHTDEDKPSKTVTPAEELPGAFPTDIGLAKEPLTELDTWPENSESNSDGYREDGKHQQNAMADDPGSEDLLPSSPLSDGNDSKLKGSLLRVLKNIVPGVRPPLTTEQRPSETRSPTMIPLPDDAKLNLDETTDVGQLSQEYLQGNSIADPISTSPVSVLEAKMQQETIRSPISPRTDTHFIDSIGSGEDQARAMSTSEHSNDHVAEKPQSPEFVHLQEKTDLLSRHPTEPIDMDRRASSPVESPSRKHVDVDILSATSVPLPDDADIDLLSAEMDVLPEHSRLILAGEHDLGLPPVSTAIERKEQLMEGATSGQDDRTTPYLSVGDKVMDEPSLTTTPVLEHEVADSATILPVTDTNQDYQATRSEHEETAEDSEPLRPSAEAGLGETMPSDSLSDSHKGTDDAASKHDTLIDRIEEAAIESPVLYSQKKGKKARKAKKQKPALESFEEVEPKPETTDGPSSTHDTDPSAQSDSAALEISEYALMDQSEKTMLDSPVVHSRKKSKKAKKQKTAFGYFEEEEARPVVIDETPSTYDAGNSTQRASTLGISQPNSNVTAYQGSDQVDQQEACLITQPEQENDAEEQPPIGVRKPDKNNDNRNLPPYPEAQDTVSTHSSLGPSPNTTRDVEESTVALPKSAEHSEPGETTSREAQSISSTLSEGPVGKVGHVVKDLFGISTNQRTKKGKKDKGFQESKPNPDPSEEQIVPAETKSQGEHTKKDKKGKKKIILDIAPSAADSAASKTDADTTSPPSVVTVKDPTTTEDQALMILTKAFKHVADTPSVDSDKESLQETTLKTSLEDPTVPVAQGGKDVSAESGPGKFAEQHLNEAVQCPLPPDDPVDFVLEGPDAAPQANLDESFSSAKKSKKENLKAEHSQVVTQEIEPTHFDATHATDQRYMADTVPECLDPSSRPAGESFRPLSPTSSTSAIKEPPQLASEPEEYLDHMSISIPVEDAVAKTEKAVDYPLHTGGGDKDGTFDHPSPALKVSDESELQSLEQDALTAAIEQQLNVEMTEPHDGQARGLDGAHSAPMLSEFNDANVGNVTAVDTEPMVDSRGHIVISEQQVVSNQETIPAAETPSAVGMNPAAVEESSMRTNEGSIAPSEEQVAMTEHDTSTVVDSQSEENSCGTKTKRKGKKGKKQREGAVHSTQLEEPRQAAFDLGERSGGLPVLPAVMQVVVERPGGEVSRSSDDDQALESSSVRETARQVPELDQGLEGSKINTREYGIIESLDEGPPDVVLGAQLLHLNPPSLDNSAQFQTAEKTVERSTADVVASTTNIQLGEEAKDINVQNNEWLGEFTSKAKNKKMKKQRRKGQSEPEADFKDQSRTEPQTLTAEAQAGSLDQDGQPVSEQLQVPIQSNDTLITLQLPAPMTVVDEPVIAFQDDDVLSYTTAKKGKKGKKSKKQQPNIAWDDGKTESGSSTPAAVLARRPENPESDPPVPKQLEVPIASQDPTIALQLPPSISTIDEPVKPLQEDELLSYTTTKKGTKGKKSRKQQLTVAWDDGATGSGSSTPAEVVAPGIDTPEGDGLGDKVEGTLAEPPAQDHALSERSNIASVIDSEGIEMSQEPEAEGMLGRAPSIKGKRGKTSKQGRVSGQVTQSTFDRSADTIEEDRDVAEDSAAHLLQTRDIDSIERPVVEDLPPLPPSRPELRVGEWVETQSQDDLPKDHAVVESLLTALIENVTHTNSDKGQLEGQITPQDIPPLPPSRSDTPTFDPSGTLVQEHIEDRDSISETAVKMLPKFPSSRPDSPIVQPAETLAHARHILPETIAGISPEAPRSRADLPVVEQSESSPQTRPEDEDLKPETAVEILPVLPSSKPTSPVIKASEVPSPTQFRDEHPEPEATLEILSHLSPSKASSPLLRPAEPLATIQTNAIPTRPRDQPAEFEVLQSLPHHRGSPISSEDKGFALSKPSEFPESKLVEETPIPFLPQEKRQIKGMEAKKGKKKNKKQKKTFDWAQPEEETSTESTLVQADKEVHSQNKLHTLSSESSTFHGSGTEYPDQVEVPVEDSHEQEAPDVTRSGLFPEHRVTSNEEVQGSLQPNRDSAVHFSDSPLIPQITPQYNSVRDSGYQDTAPSPMVYSAQDFTPSSRSQSPARDKIESSLLPDTLHQRPATLADLDFHSTERSAPVDLGHSPSPTRSPPRPLRVSVELDPAYELSVSKDLTEMPRSRIRPGDTVDMGLDLPNTPPSNELQPFSDYAEDRNSAPLSQHEQQQPSPVESATKDRSSVLFYSSPSTREDTTDGPITQPTWHYTEDRVPTAPFETSASTDADLGISGLRDTLHDRSQSQPATIEPVASLATLAGIPDNPRTPRTSLFGGPMGTDSNSTFVASPPSASLGLTGSERVPLDTIEEYSPEASPLQTRNRALSDVGSPERGIKAARRARSPQTLGSDDLQTPSVPSLGLTPAPHPPGKAPDNSTLSTDDFIARLSWPAVDEDNHSVDLDRVKSRNTDRRPSSHNSNGSTRLREGEIRSASGQSIRSGGSINRFMTPDREHINRPGSGFSNRSVSGTGTNTPPLRRVDRRLSGDLRAASKRGEAKNLAKQPDLGLDDPNIPSSSTYDPIKDKGKGRVKDMASVYEGWGDVPGSPLSPTRPASVRRRQSMHIIDLETKLDQLASENRLLQDAKSKAERGFQEQSFVHDRNEQAAKEALETRDLELHEKDSEIVKLRETLEWVQKEVARLTEVNQSLTAANLSISSTRDQRFTQLQLDHDIAKQQWQQSTKELEELRQQHVHLSTGMEDIVRHEIGVALEDKNAELRRLRDELETAKVQVRALQQQILASKPSDDVLVTRDEDYFESQCQQLCQHIQQWVLRFSKFSDMKACRLASDIADEKITDRFDNAILDGSDVDHYLADRIRRRDVFMSVVMTMVWEFIFTRYLFGMDREQRQKLKSLEKLLAEVGPMKSVHRWRATTLMLLSRRPAFQAQRAQDTEAVVQEIYQTLATFLPPPSHLVKQIQESLRNVMRAAVELSIEMRTQRAEYIMLPPLQPEYDTNGDLTRKVYFNAAVMNERSGDTSSNEELEAQHAVVRMVLFPLVVKKGDESGLGNEEIVVCPAQVLVAKPGKEKKVVRVLSGDRMSVDQPNKSVQSFAPSSMDMGNMI